jgi:hypothetical protein
MTTSISSVRFSPFLPGASARNRIAGMFTATIGTPTGSGSQRQRSSVSSAWRMRIAHGVRRRDIVTGPMMPSGASA